MQKVREKYMKLNIIALFVFVDDNIYLGFRPFLHKLPSDCYTPSKRKWKTL